MGDPGSIPGLGRSPGEGNGNPLQYSCLEKSHGLEGYVCVCVCVCMCVCVCLKRQNAMGEREGNPEMEKESGSKEGEQI